MSLVLNTSNESETKKKEWRMNAFETGERWGKNKKMD